MTIYVTLGVPETRSMVHPLRTNIYEVRAFINSGGRVFSVLFSVKAKSDEIVEVIQPA